MYGEGEKEKMRRFTAFICIITLLFTSITGLEYVEVRAGEETKTQPESGKDDRLSGTYGLIITDSNDDVLISHWNSFFGFNNGWFEGAEGTLVSADDDSWIANLESVGWGGIWGGQIYRQSDVEIEKGKKYTLKCKLISTDCDKWVFITLKQDGDNYAYGKWIKLEKGIEIFINETFIAENDADWIYFCMGGEAKGGASMFDQEIYSFLDGGADVLDDEDSKLSTQIVCGNISLVSAEETVTTGTPVNTEEQTTQSNAIKQETTNTVPKMTTSSKKPAKVSVSKVQNSKKGQVKISWKKIRNASGYQVSYATNKKFTKSKKTITVKKSVKSAVIKKLKKKKTYYIRVRAYKVVNGKKVYGSWSKVKKVKIKN